MAREWDVVTQTYLEADYVRPPRPSNRRPCSCTPRCEPGHEDSFCLSRIALTPEDLRWLDACAAARDRWLVPRLVAALTTAYATGDLPEWRRLYNDGYLKTLHWHQTRRQAQKRAGEQCQAYAPRGTRCPHRIGLEVHHWSYARLGAERHADLAALCREHHQAVHDGTLEVEDVPDAKVAALTAGCLTKDGAYTAEWAVACPTCGFDFSHVRHAGTLLGGDEGGVYPGTQIVGETAERRSALSIVFDGECGHAWELRIQQHKGVNLLEVHALPANAEAFE